ncbi:MAG: Crp/Fnr family transcriptional regulator [Anaerolineae bacterium]|nr:Crp/Fnr family transcriptional regulator [Anaerolineae bacterium]
MAPIHATEATRQQLIADLCAHEFFRTLDDARLARLADAAVCHRFAAGEVIFLEGDDAAAALWIVNAGRVKVYKLSPEGVEYIVHLFGPGDAFNEVAALDGGPAPANAAAISDVTACCLDHAAIVALVEQDPALALTLVNIATSHTRILLKQIEELALYSVVVRMARFLLTHAENPAFSGPGVTRSTIAAHLATTPETVSRALSKLENIGVLQVDRHEIVVINEEGLRLIAQF